MGDAEEIIKARQAKEQEDKKQKEMVKRRAEQDELTLLRRRLRVAMSMIASVEYFNGVIITITTPKGGILGKKWKKVDKVAWGIGTETCWSHGESWSRELWMDRDGYIYRGSKSSIDRGFRSHFEQESTKVVHQACDSLEHAVNLPTLRRVNREIDEKISATHGISREAVSERLNLLAEGRSIDTTFVESLKIRLDAAFAWLDTGTPPQRPIPTV